MIRYDGVLKRQPSSTSVAVVFSIYGSHDQKNPLWQETQNIQPEQDGRYTVFLGALVSGGCLLSYSMQQNRDGLASGSAVRIMSKKPFWSGNFLTVRL